LRIEFLLDEASFKPHHATFIKNLELLGIEAEIRLIDAVQYRARVEAFDFEITTERMSMSSTPGDGLRPYFSSQAAATKGSYNLAGIASPVIDALIERVIAAETRSDLKNACRSGTAALIRLPIGTSSLIPTSRRNMRRASARLITGGTTRPRPRNSSRRSSR
jgi:ABC-type oligopeptide transport system substrate-binding subunit